jgi:hypothetical protein
MTVDYHYPRIMKLIWSNIDAKEVVRCVSPILLSCARWHLKAGNRTSGLGASTDPRVSC